MLILFDYKATCSKLKNLLYIAKKISEEITAMEEEIEELGIFWDSDAMGEYALRITADLYTARAMLERIKQSIRTLSEVIIKFDLTEKKVMSMIDSM